MAFSCCSSKTAKRIGSFTSVLDGNGNGPEGLPTFEDILLGNVPDEPWRPQTFLEFLHVERNDENMFFYEEVEAFKASQGKTAKTPPDELLILPKDVRKDPVQYSQKIIETFVKESAPKQVNISDEQRKRLLGDAVQSTLEAQGYEPEIFEEAQTEVRRLMQLDSWPRFRKKMLTQNIMKADSMGRLYEGAFFLLLTLLGAGLILGLQPSRFYLFILIFPVYFMYEDFVTYQMSFCVRNAMKGLRDRFGKNHEKSIIVCPITKASQKHMMRRVFAVIVGSTILTVGFFFALSFIIEAGVGRTLY